MYFKLALKNVKKSYKDFLIYFLTLAFSVCLFYTFNSFQAQQAVLNLNKAQSQIVDSISVIMGLLSNFVSVVLAFLILYANSFLIKRRKREFGLYMLLGMPKQQISKVLVYETLLIGLISLIAGIALGLLISQLLTVLTASMFTVTLNYHFVFSFDSTFITIFAFAVIFFIVMIFNAFIINRYKLIDLITAGHRNEKPRVRNLWLSVLIFLVSLALLGYAYYTAIDKGMMFVETLTPIILAGSIGTVLFFLSLSGFLLKFIQTSKRLYYRKLNMFVLRQINSKINSNFLSMSVVCIMLRLSIGALSTGITLRNTINDSTEVTIPFNYTGVSNHHEIITELVQYAKDDSRIKNQMVINSYQDKDLTADLLVPYSKPMRKLDPKNIKNTPLDIYKLSEFNRKRELTGKPKLSLKANEAYMFTSLDSLTEYVDPILGKNAVLKLYGKEITVTNKAYELEQLGTAQAGYNVTSASIGLVVDDAYIPNNALPASSIWNVNLNKGVSEKKFQSEMSDKMFELQGQKAYMGQSYLANETRSGVLENAVGTSVMFTYVGLYLGIVFLVASAVILALQQLSEAEDSHHRYQILKKIGAEKRMLNQSVLMQIGIYFIMPLGLAIVHSFIGIKVVNSVLILFGKLDIMSSSLFTALLILIFYGSYFLLTYFGYNRILQQEKA